MGCPSYVRVSCGVGRDSTSENSLRFDIAGCAKTGPLPAVMVKSPAVSLVWDKGWFLRATLVDALIL